LPLDTKAAATGAQRIEQLAPMIRETFAMDTRGFRLDTHALDRIWQNPRQFDESIKDLTWAARSLDRAARSGDPVLIARAVKTVVEACDACHQVFRDSSAEHLAQ
jgi:cytochrome c556